MNGSELFLRKFTLCCYCYVQYLPPVDGRARCGFVGLKNGGATCYMNSVIQQLYMVPGIPEVVLGVEEDKADEERSGFKVTYLI